MDTKRIFAGALAALLLCVPSLAAACDLSCEFSQFTSDCHSAQMVPSESPDMSMGGMSMPNVADEGAADQRAISSSQQALPIHAVLGDVGPCARQSCDQAQGLNTHANQCAPHFQSISRIAGCPDRNRLRIALYNARDSIAPLSPTSESALHASLRI